MPDKFLPPHPMEYRQAEGWNMRQPELDALRAENERLRAALADEREHVGELQEQLAEVSQAHRNRARAEEADVERLRAAAQAVIDDPLLNDASESWRNLRNVLWADITATSSR